MNSVTQMQMPSVSSSQVFQSRNHIHQIKLAAVVPPSLYKFDSPSDTVALMPPILRLHFFNLAKPTIHSQFLVVDFKEQLLDSITVEPCARGVQVKVFK